MSLRTTGSVIVRNAVRRGYPLLEPIRSTLPIRHDCPISDACSSAETCEAPTGLQARHRDEIHVRRTVWSGRTGERPTADES